MYNFILYISACISIFSYCSTGGHVVHSYGRLIPQFFPITDLQQISGPDGIGRINCTVSSGTARLGRLWPKEAGRLTTKHYGTTATLVVSPTDEFVNSELYCELSQFYLYTSSNSEFIQYAAHAHTSLYSFTISDYIFKVIRMTLYMH